MDHYGPYNYDILVKISQKVFLTLLLTTKKLKLFRRPGNSAAASNEWELDKKIFLAATVPDNL